MKCVKCGNEKPIKKQCRICQKEYQVFNKEKISEYKRIYRQNNKTKIAAGNKLYYIENKDRYLALNNKRFIIRYNNDPVFKLRNLCSRSIRFYLKQGKEVKIGSILKYLPYSMDDLKVHLVSQFSDWMNWDNYGAASAVKRTWQIDHIIPQSKLPYSYMTDENFKKCWALKNLRPLESFENIRKSNK